MAKTYEKLYDEFWLSKKSWDNKDPRWKRVFYSQSELDKLRRDIEKRLCERDTTELPRDGCRAIVWKVINESFDKLGVKK